MAHPTIKDDFNPTCDVRRVARGGLTDVAGGTEIALSRRSSWSRLVSPLQTPLRVFFYQFLPLPSFILEGEGFMTQLFHGCSG